MLRGFLCLALFITSAAWGSTALAAGPKPPPPTCANFLAGNLYGCTYTPENLIAQHLCVFAASDVGDQVGLDLGGGVFAHCNCNPTGRGKALKFRSSRSAFTCSLDVNGSPAAGALAAKVTGKGKAITGGVGIVNTGSFTLSCVVDPTCTP